MNQLNQHYWGDRLLQSVMIMALIVVVLMFYFSRIVGSQAVDVGVNPQLEWLSWNAFQLQQEELKTLSKIKTLKADFAGDLLNFKKEKILIVNSKELSDLEIREKLMLLEQFYNEVYFNKKQALIDEQVAKLDLLKKVECQKFCTYQDL